MKPETSHSSIYGKKVLDKDKIFKGVGYTAVIMGHYPLTILTHESLRFGLLD